MAKVQWPKCPLMSKSNIERALSCRKSSAERALSCRKCNAERALLCRTLARSKRISKRYPPRSHLRFLSHFYRSTFLPKVDKVSTFQPEVNTKSSPDPRGVPRGFPQEVICASQVTSLGALARNRWARTGPLGLHPEPSKLPHNLLHILLHNLLHNFLCNLLHNLLTATSIVNLLHKSLHNFSIRRPIFASEVTSLGAPARNRGAGAGPLGLFPRSDSLIQGFTITYMIVSLHQNYLTISHTICFPTALLLLVWSNY